MTQSLFPWAAFRYVKQITKIREWERVDKSAIIHCAMEFFKFKFSKSKRLLWIIIDIMDYYILALRQRVEFASEVEEKSIYLELWILLPVIISAVITTTALITTYYCVRKSKCQNGTQ